VHNFLLLSRPREKFFFAPQFLSQTLALTLLFQPAAAFLPSRV
jgi:hypothetical protein